ncbi:hypothetical protein D4R86_04960 [bacterium]|nr:MAG: hypothetical protein D4R86_04960 [bacterium]
MKNIFFNTNTQKVLRFFIQNPTQFLLASDVIKNTNISRAGINFALRELLKEGLIQKEAKGKAYIYRVESELSVLKQLKVLDSVMKLHPLVKKIESLAEKIILFGSCARGENTEDSDIDLMMISHNKDEIKDGLCQFKKLPIKSMIKTPIEFADLEKKDPTFYLEITRGIVLFEKNNE